MRIIIVHCTVHNGSNFKHKFNNMENVNILKTQLLAVIISRSELIGLGQYFACDLRVEWNWGEIWWARRVWSAYRKWTYGHVWFVFVQ